MSVPNQIEPFDNEVHLNINSDRISGASEGNIEEENSNDNIIFHDGDSSLDVDKKTNSRVFCGIKGDSELSCILNIIVSAIGVGCFNFPFIMYEGGILVSLIIFIFVTLCIYYTIDLLRSFVVDTKYFSYALMTETILGPKWLKTYAICSFTIYTSMEVSYISSIYLYINGIFDDLSKVLYFIISIIIEIIICLYITKINYMHFLSITSLFCFILMLISLIIVSILANISGKFTSSNLFFPKLPPNDFWNILFKVSSYIMVYVYAYSYHSTFPTLIGSLKNVSHSNTKKVHIISFGIISVAYLLISIFGFMLSEVVPNEIFQEKDDLFTGDWETLIKPFKIIIALFLLFLIPIRFIVLRDNYTTLFGRKKMTFFKEMPIVGIFVIICNIIAYYISKSELDLTELQIKTLFITFGGMFGVIIAFCLPVVNYVAVNGKKKIRSIIGYIILGIFSIFAILSFGHTFYHLFKDVKINKKDK